MGAAPLSPASRAAQELCTSSPTGVSSPVPVITTRRFIGRSVVVPGWGAAPGGRAKRRCRTRAAAPSLSVASCQPSSGLLGVRLDVVDGVAPRLELLRLLVRDLH